MAKQLTIHEGDYGPLGQLAFIIKDTDGVVVDLTDATTIVIKVATKGAQAVVLKFTATCTVVLATAGTVTYNPAAGNFDTVTSHQIQFTVSNASGQSTYDWGAIRVRDVYS